ncbi:MAG: hypothetical protein JTT11_01345 [Candidatus Brockarchaeota archaeon]|nr:hypothetical protein [Candidatus Brockarchaeota archaeon]
MGKMVELSEKAFALSLSMVLVAAGFVASKTSLFPKVSTAAALARYDALVEKLRQEVQKASEAPARLQFGFSIPPGVSIRGDGKALVLEIETALGKRSDRIQTPLEVEVQASALSGDVVVVVDSTAGLMVVKIGGG